MLEAVLFPVYFVLGFFLYSAFFSGLAATCETAQDLQMYISLAVIPTWTSFAILPFLLNNPNSPWVVAASLFPPTAPLVMVPRIGMSTSPYLYWQIALSHCPADPQHLGRDLVRLAPLSHRHPHVRQARHPARNPALAPLLLSERSESKDLRLAAYSKI